MLDRFQKAKILGPDGWIVQFFDMMGEELLVVVEDSRLKGKVSSALNANFIAMIPKSGNPGSFKDFRPITLCNMVYKVITKVIENKLNPMLSKE